MKWENDFDLLLHFIADHPSISIRPSTISIPTEIRGEFYSLFQKVRYDFVEELMERRLEKAYQLTENWSVVSEQVKEKYSLSNIELDRVLATFIKDPLDTLAGFIFSDLFDVLRSNISIDDFSINSTRLLTRKASELFKRGYSRYICLKLLLFLNGSELYTAFSPDSSYDADAVNGTPSLNRFDEPPQIKRTEQLVFEYSASCGFLSSRMITYSPVLEKYVALRCDHYSPFWNSSKRSTNRQWLNIDEIQIDYGLNDLWPDMYVYFSDSIDDLNICSERTLLCRPDINLEFVIQNNINIEKKACSVKRHATITKPTHGTIVLCYESIEPSVFNQIINDSNSNPVKATMNDSPLVIMERTQQEQENAEPLVYEETGAVEETSCNSDCCDVGTEDPQFIKLINIKWETSLLEKELNNLVNPKTDSAF